MIELTSKAENYAAEKTNELMTKTIAQAYADGYRDGYKDREEEIPVDLRDNKTEYVDLGLPSGTLWSNNYETKDGNAIYLTHKESMDYKIPSVNQWKELMSCCRWKFKKGSTWSLFYCIGPNGNQISFHSTGIITTEKTHSSDLFFWLYDMDNAKMDKHVAYANINKDVRPFVVTTRLGEIFEGYKLPIRLVQTKIKE